MESRGLWDHSKLWEQQPLAWCGLGAAGLVLGVAVALVTPFGGNGVGPAANPAVAVTEAPEAAPTSGVGRVVPDDARATDPAAPAAGVDRKRVQPVTAPTSGPKRPTRDPAAPPRGNGNGNGSGQDDDQDDDGGVEPSVPVDDDDGGVVEPTQGTDPTPDPGTTDCPVIGQAAGALLGAPCP